MNDILAQASPASKIHRFRLLRWWCHLTTSQLRYPLTHAARRKSVRFCSSVSFGGVCVVGRVVTWDTMSWCVVCARGELPECCYFWAKPDFLCLCVTSPGAGRALGGVHLLACKPGRMSFLLTVKNVSYPPLEKERNVSHPGEENEQMFCTPTNVSYPVRFLTKLKMFRTPTLQFEKCFKW